MRRFATALTDVEEQLQASGRSSLADRAAAYKRLLETYDGWLEQQRKKHSGLTLGRMRSDIMDAWLSHLLEVFRQRRAATRAKPLVVAFVIVGGYGRRELNPCSDLDFTILHTGRINPPDGLAELVQELLTIISACGFKTGESTRNLNETVAEANKEMMTKTALLDTRLLWGDEGLYAKFKTRFQKECVAPFIQDYLMARVADQAKRHAKDGDVVDMQEPNIKDGCGGLRDYQNLLWMARFKYGLEEIQSTADLVERKYLDEAERREIDRAYEWIFRLRTELHYFTQKPVDKIFVGQQKELADRLGYDQPNVLRRVETFMRDYYSRARSIFEITELISERLALPTQETTKRLGFFRLPSLMRPRPKRREEFDGFVACEGRLHYLDRQIFKADKTRMMRLFLYVQQRGLAMSAELRQLVRRRLKYVDNTFRYAKANREVFADILRHKGQVGGVLRAMHRLDFLGRWLPEFGALTSLVQHEFFHRYTVDEHTLVTIEKLDGLLTTEDERFQLHKELFRKVEDPYPLYLALILHDTGKAANAKDHVTESTIRADRVCRRLQLTREQRALLIFLVNNHDLLAKTPRQRDIYDPETLEWVAGVVGNQENLDALMLITAADGLGVGNDKLWNDWSQSLVRDLYRRLTRYFSDGEAFHAQQKIERSTLQEAVSERLGEDYADEIHAHFRGMPERYFQLPHGRDTAVAITGHIKMVREFLETRWNSDGSALAPIIRWVAQKNAGHSELWVCTWDRSELLARIAGALSTAELNILSADIFTRADGIVLDKFRVTTNRFEAVEHPVDLRKVDRLLNEALAVESYDFGPQLAKARSRAWGRQEGPSFLARVWYDNSPPHHTAFEVLAADRLGLLYDLLGCIADAGFEISAARITTENGAAMDTFHLTAPEGAKISDEGALATLKQAVLKLTSAPKGA